MVNRSDLVNAFMALGYKQQDAERFAGILLNVIAPIETGHHYESPEAAKAVSPAGAFGALQIHWPSWRTRWRRLSVPEGYFQEVPPESENYREVPLKYPKFYTRLAAAVSHELAKAGGVNVPLLLSGDENELRKFAIVYNAGPRALRRKNLPQETINYIKKAIKLFRNWQQGGDNVSDNSVVLPFTEQPDDAEDWRQRLGIRTVAQRQTTTGSQQQQQQGEGQTLNVWEVLRRAEMQGTSPTTPPAQATQPTQPTQPTQSVPFVQPTQLPQPVQPPPPITPALPSVVPPVQTVVPEVPPAVGEPLVQPTALSEAQPTVPSEAQPTVPSEAPPATGQPPVQPMVQPVEGEPPIISRPTFLSVIEYQLNKYRRAPDTSTRLNEKAYNVFTQILHSQAVSSNSKKPGIKRSNGTVSITHDGGTITVPEYVVSNFVNDIASASAKEGITKFAVGYIDSLAGQLSHYNVAHKAYKPSGLHLEDITKRTAEGVEYFVNALNKNYGVQVGAPTVRIREAGDGENYTVNFVFDDGERHSVKIDRDTMRRAVLMHGIMGYAAVQGTVPVISGESVILQTPGRYGVEVAHVPISHANLRKVTSFDSDAYVRRILDEERESSLKSLSESNLLPVTVYVNAKFGDKVENISFTAVLNNDPDKNPIDSKTLIYQVPLLYNRFAKEIADAEGDEKRIDALNREFERIIDFINSEGRNYRAGARLHKEWLGQTGHFVRSVIDAGHLTAAYLGITPFPQVDNTVGDKVVRKFLSNNEGIVPYGPAGRGTITDFLLSMANPVDWALWSKFYKMLVYAGRGSKVLSRPLTQQLLKRSPVVASRVTQAAYDRAYAHIAKQIQKAASELPSELSVPTEKLKGALERALMRQPPAREVAEVVPEEIVKEVASRVPPSVPSVLGQAESIVESAGKPVRDALAEVTRLLAKPQLDPSDVEQLSLLLRTIGGEEGAISRFLDKTGVKLGKESTVNIIKVLTSQIDTPARMRAIALGKYLDDILPFVQHRPINVANASEELSISDRLITRLLMGLGGEKVVLPNGARVPAFLAADIARRSIVADALAGAVLPVAGIYSEVWRTGQPLGSTHLDPIIYATLPMLAVAGTGHIMHVLLSRHAARNVKHAPTVDQEALGYKLAALFTGDGSPSDAAMQKALDLIKRVHHDRSIMLAQRGIEHIDSILQGNPPEADNLLKQRQALVDFLKRQGVDEKVINKLSLAPWVPKAPLAPGEPSGLKGVEVPGGPLPPRVPEVPRVPETAGVPEVPEVPRVPETAGVPEVPEVPRVPETAGVPEVPEVPRVPRAPADVTPTLRVEDIFDEDAAKLTDFEEFISELEKGTLPAPSRKKPGAPPAYPSPEEGDRASTALRFTSPEGSVVATTTRVESTVQPEVPQVPEVPRALGEAPQVPGVTEAPGILGEVPRVPEVTEALGTPGELGAAPKVSTFMPIPPRELLLTGSGLGQHVADGTVLPGSAIRVLDETHHIQRLVRKQPVQRTLLPISRLIGDDLTISIGDKKIDAVGFYYNFLLGQKPQVAMEELNSLAVAGSQVPTTAYFDFKVLNAALRKKVPYNAIVNNSAVAEQDIARALRVVDYTPGTIMQRVREELELALLYRRRVAERFFDYQKSGREYFQNALATQQVEFKSEHSGGVMKYAPFQMRSISSDISNFLHDRGGVGQQRSFEWFLLKAAVNDLSDPERVSVTQRIIEDAWGGNVLAIGTPNITVGKAISNAKVEDATRDAMTKLLVVAVANINKALSPLGVKFKVNLPERRGAGGYNFSVRSWRDESSFVNAVNPKVLEATNQLADTIAKASTLVVKNDVDALSKMLKDELAPVFAPGVPETFAAAAEAGPAPVHDYIGNAATMYRLDINRGIGDTLHNAIGYIPGLHLLHPDFVGGKTLDNFRVTEAAYKIASLVNRRESPVPARIFNIIDDQYATDQMLREAGIDEAEIAQLNDALNRTVNITREQPVRNYIKYWFTSNNLKQLLSNPSIENRLIEQLQFSSIPISELITDPDVAARSAYLEDLSRRTVELLKQRRTIVQQLKVGSSDVEQAKAVAEDFIGDVFIPAKGKAQKVNKLADIDEQLQSHLFQLVAEPRVELFEQYNDPQMRHNVVKTLDGLKYGVSLPFADFGDDTEGEQDDEQKFLGLGLLAFGGLAALSGRRGSIRTHSIRPLTRPQADTRRLIEQKWRDIRDFFNKRFRSITPGPQGGGIGVLRLPHPGEVPEFEALNIRPDLDVLNAARQVKSFVNADPQAFVATPIAGISPAERAAFVRHNFLLSDLPFVEAEQKVITQRDIFSPFSFVYGVAHIVGNDLDRLWTHTTELVTEAGRREFVVPELEAEHALVRSILNDISEGHSPQDIAERLSRFYGDRRLPSAEEIRLKLQEVAGERDKITQELKKLGPGQENTQAYRRLSERLAVLRRRESELQDISETGSQEVLRQELSDIESKIELTKLQISSLPEVHFEAKSLPPEVLQAMLKFERLQERRKSLISEALGIREYLSKPLVAYGQSEAAAHLERVKMLQDEIVGLEERIRQIEAQSPASPELASLYGELKSKRQQLSTVGEPPITADIDELLANNRGVASRRLKEITEELKGVKGEILQNVRLIAEHMPEASPTLLRRYKLESQLKSLLDKRSVLYKALASSDFVQETIEPLIKQLESATTASDIDAVISQLLQNVSAYQFTKSGGRSLEESVAERIFRTIQGIDDRWHTSPLITYGKNAEAFMEAFKRADFSTPLGTLRSLLNVPAVVDSLNAKGIGATIEEITRYIYDKSAIIELGKAASLWDNFIESVRAGDDTTKVATEEELRRAAGILAEHIPTYRTEFSAIARGVTPLRPSEQFLAALENNFGLLANDAISKLALRHTAKRYGDFVKGVISGIFNDIKTTIYEDVVKLARKGPLESEDDAIRGLITESGEEFAIDTSQLLTGDKELDELLSDIPEVSEVSEAAPKLPSRVKYRYALPVTVLNRYVGLLRSHGIPVDEVINPHVIRRYWEDALANVAILVEPTEHGGLSPLRVEGTLREAVDPASFFGELYIPFVSYTGIDPMLTPHWLIDERADWRAKVVPRLEIIQQAIAGHDATQAWSVVFAGFHDEATQVKALLNQAAERGIDIARNKDLRTALERHARDAFRYVKLGARLVGETGRVALSPVEIVNLLYGLQPVQLQRELVNWVTGLAENARLLRRDGMVAIGPLTLTPADEAVVKLMKRALDTTSLPADEAARGKHFTALRILNVAVRDPGLAGETATSLARLTADEMYKLSEGPVRHVIDRLKATERFNIPGDRPVVNLFYGRDLTPEDYERIQRVEEAVYNLASPVAFDPGHARIFTQYLYELGMLGPSLGKLRELPSVRNLTPESYRKMSRKNVGPQHKAYMSLYQAVYGGDSLVTDVTSKLLTISKIEGDDVDYGFLTRAMVGAERIPTQRELVVKQLQRENILPPRLEAVLADSFDTASIQDITDALVLSRELNEPRLSYGIKQWVALALNDMVGVENARNEAVWLARTILSYGPDIVKQVRATGGSADELLLRVRDALHKRDEESLRALLPGVGEEVNFELYHRPIAGSSDVMEKVWQLPVDESFVKDYVSHYLTNVRFAYADERFKGVNQARLDVIGSAVARLAREPNLFERLASGIVQTSDDQFVLDVMNVVGRDVVQTMVENVRAGRFDPLFEIGLMKRVLDDDGAAALSRVEDLLRPYYGPNAAFFIKEMESSPLRYMDVAGIIGERLLKGLRNISHRSVDAAVTRKFYEWMRINRDVIRQEVMTAAGEYADNLGALFNQDPELESRILTFVGLPKFAMAPEPEAARIGMRAVQMLEGLSSLVPRAGWRPEAFAFFALPENEDEGEKETHWRNVAMGVVGLLLAGRVGNGWLSRLFTSSNITKQLEHLRANRFRHLMRSFVPSSIQGHQTVHFGTARLANIIVEAIAPVWKVVNKSDHYIRQASDEAMHITTTEYPIDQRSKLRSDILAALQKVQRGVDLVDNDHKHAILGVMQYVEAGWLANGLLHLYNSMPRSLRNEITKYDVSDFLNAVRVAEAVALAGGGSSRGMKTELERAATRFYYHMSNINTGNMITSPGAKDAVMENLGVRFVELAKLLNAVEDSIDDAARPVAGPAGPGQQAGASSEAVDKLFSAALNKGGDFITRLADWYRGTINGLFADERFIVLPRVRITPDKVVLVQDVDTNFVYAALPGYERESDKFLRNRVIEAIRSIQAVSGQFPNFNPDRDLVMLHFPEGRTGNVLDIRIGDTPVSIKPGGDNVSVHVTVGDNVHLLKFGDTVNVAGMNFPAEFFDQLYRVHGNMYRLERISNLYNIPILSRLGVSVSQLENSVMMALAELLAGHDTGFMRRFSSDYIVAADDLIAAATKVTGGRGLLDIDLGHARVPEWLRRITRTGKNIAVMMLMHFHASMTANQVQSLRMDEPYSYILAPDGVDFFTLQKAKLAAHSLVGEQVRESSGKAVWSLAHLHPLVWPQTILGTFKKELVSEFPRFLRRGKDGWELNISGTWKPIQEAVEEIAPGWREEAYGHPLRRLGLPISSTFEESGPFLGGLVVLDELTGKMSDVWLGLFKRYSEFANRFTVPLASFLAARASGIDEERAIQLARQMQIATNTTHGPVIKAPLLSGRVFGRQPLGGPLLQEVLSGALFLTSTGFQQVGEGLRAYTRFLRNVAKDMSPGERSRFVANAVNGLAMPVILFGLGGSAALLPAEAIYQGVRLYKDGVWNDGTEMEHTLTEYLLGPQIGFATRLVGGGLVGLGYIWLMDQIVSRLTGNDVGSLGIGGRLSLVDNVAARLFHIWHEKGTDWLSKIKSSFVPSKAVEGIIALGRLGAALYSYNHGNDELLRDLQSAFPSVMRRQYIEQWLDLVKKKPESVLDIIERLFGSDGIMSENPEVRRKAVAILATAFSGLAFTNEKVASMAIHGAAETRQLGTDAQAARRDRVAGLLRGILSSPTIEGAEDAANQFLDEFSGMDEVAIQDVVKNLGPRGFLDMAYDQFSRRGGGYQAMVAAMTLLKANPGGPIGEAVLRVLAKRTGMDPALITDKWFSLGDSEKQRVIFEMTRSLMGVPRSVGSLEELSRRMVEHQRDIPRRVAGFLHVAILRHQLDKAVRNLAFSDQVPVVAGAEGGRVFEEGAVKDFQWDLGSMRNIVLSVPIVVSGAGGGDVLHFISVADIGRLYRELPTDERVSSDEYLNYADNALKFLDRTSKVRLDAAVEAYKRTTGQALDWKVMGDLMKILLGTPPQTMGYYASRVNDFLNKLWKVFYFIELHDRLAGDDDFLNYAFWSKVHDGVTMTGALTGRQFVGEGPILLEEIRRLEELLRKDIDEEGN